MAEQDVQVKDVDAIRTYNQKFGDFYTSIHEHMHRLQRILQEKQDMLQQALRDMKKEMEKIDDEIHQAKRREDDAYSGGAQNDDDIRKCREEREHLEGSVYHHAKTCKELGHSKLMQSTQLIEGIINRTRKLDSEFQTYVSNGRTFLKKAEMHIDQYRSSNHQ